MASLRMIKRQEKRVRLVQKYLYKRMNLKLILKDRNKSVEEKEKAEISLQKLPRDSSKCRLRNRCFETGRSRGVYRFVGLCRNMFRFYAMRGDIPGFRKSSW